MPNFLCVLRIIAVPIFAFFLVWDFKDFDSTFGARIAVLIYFLASITDIFDGRIARKYHLESRLGQILDPLADKLLVLTGFLCPLYRGILPWWFVALTFLREVIVMGMCAEGIYRKISMPPLYSGKVKTVLQMSTIVGILLFMCISTGLEWNGFMLIEYGDVNLLTIFVSGIAWAGLITSYYSLFFMIKIFIDAKRRLRSGEIITKIA